MNMSVYLWQCIYAHVYVHIHRSSITLRPPVQYCVGPLFAAKTALTRWGMDSTRPLKVCCCILHQDVSNLSFKSCKLWGGASTDWTGLSSTSHRWSIGLRSGEFGGPSQHLKLIVWLLKRSWNISALWLIILLKEATAIWEYPFHERVFMVCSTAEVGGTCQSHIPHGWQDPRFPSRTLPKASGKQACLLPIVYPGAMCSSGK